MTKLQILKLRFMHDPKFRREYAKAHVEYARIEAALEGDGGAS